MWTRKFALLETINKSWERKNWINFSLHERTIKNCLKPREICRDKRSELFVRAALFSVEVSTPTKLTITSWLPLLCVSNGGRDDDDWGNWKWEKICRQVSVSTKSFSIVVCWPVDRRSSHWNRDWNYYENSTEKIIMIPRIIIWNYYYYSKNLSCVTEIKVSADTKWLSSPLVGSEFENLFSAPPKNCVLPNYYQPITIIAVFICPWRYLSRQINVFRSPSLSLTSKTLSTHSAESNWLNKKHHENHTQTKTLLKQTTAHEMRRERDTEKKDRNNYTIYINRVIIIIWRHNMKLRWGTWPKRSNAVRLQPFRPFE